MWDGHLESRKNPDRLKRSIHVDRIGVHSTFVYIYAGLRALMSWAYCLFSFNVFSFEKSRRYDDNQQITVSHFGEQKRLHLESSKRNCYIISFTSKNKSNLHSPLTPHMYVCAYNPHGYKQSAHPTAHLRSRSFHYHNHLFPLLVVVL